MRRFIFVFLAAASLCAAPPAAVKWAVYYSDTAPVSALLPFDLLVFDSDSHPDLRALSERGKTAVGYLSIGEVANSRSYFEAVRSQGILLQENQNWPGSYFVDVRDGRWTKRVIEQLVPSILRRGFKGVFLDTVDNAVYLEQQSPTRYKGMMTAMVNLIKAIRRNYPQARIIVNRGFEILPKIEKDIDMVLGESMYTTYDFETKKYSVVPQAEYRQQAKVLTDAKRRRPQLTILTLDYWDPADSAFIRQIYAAQRASGFNPYVATIELDRVVQEPVP